MRSHATSSSRAPRTLYVGDPRERRDELLCFSSRESGMERPTFGPGFVQVATAGLALI